jgi:hypothetical protein
LAVTAINQGTDLLLEVDLDLLTNGRHNVKLTGQVMSLTAIPALALVPDAIGNMTIASLDSGDSQDSMDSDSQMTLTWSWLWAEGYIKTKSSITGTDKASEKIIVVHVPGHLVIALNPQMVCADQLQHLLLTENKHIQLNSKRLIWTFDGGGLGLLRDTLWNQHIGNCSWITHTCKAAYWFSVPAGWRSWVGL